MKKFKKTIIAVAINKSGNVGKTTASKSWAPLLAEASDRPCLRIEFEEINAGDGDSDRYSANRFYDVAPMINVLRDKSAIIDVGSSAVLSFLEGMRELSSTREMIDLWIVPVVPMLKQCADTCTTVLELLSIGVDPNRIAIVANKIVDVTVDMELLDRVRRFSSEHGVHFCSQAWRSDDVFEWTKENKKNVFEIAADEFDKDQLIEQAGDDIAMQIQVGKQMMIRDKAKVAARNLRAVFDEISGLLTMVER